jgi:hypothetical protein
MWRWASPAANLISWRNRGAERRSELGPEHLDRNGAIVLPVVREIHGGHSPAAEAALDGVPLGEGSPQAGRPPAPSPLVKPFYDPAPSRPSCSSPRRSGLLDLGVPVDRRLKAADRRYLYISEDLASKHRYAGRQ